MLPDALRNVDGTARTFQKKKRRNTVAVPRKMRSSRSTVVVFQQHVSARLFLMRLCVFSLECWILGAQRGFHTARNISCVSFLSPSTPSTNVICFHVFDHIDIEQLEC